MEDIKKEVRKAYTMVASQVGQAPGCCGFGCDCNTSTIDEAIMADSYAHLDGYVPEADLGLGCGLPTEFANLATGQTVLDLGSGAGNDAFVARHLVGQEGKVIGVDFTPAMIKLARKNAEKLGFNNVEFRQGDIEARPVEDQTVDVIISNCVLNLVPNKPAVFSQMHRVLKPGGHFSISDIVLIGELPEDIKKAAEMYYGCVTGAIQKEDYLNGLKNAGFENIEIVKEKKIELPDSILTQYMESAQIKTFKDSGVSILSITVNGKNKNETCNEQCCAACS
jgi:ubiquinone/menaquinone biosynthesis C-methylase UbiE